MMKALITFSVALLGLGGWLYVELSPYPPSTRSWRLSQLPGFAHLNDFSSIRMAKQAFEDAPDGWISFPMRTETVSWFSFEEWKQDFDAHDGPARVWDYSLRYADEREKASDLLTRNALTGDISSLIAFMGMGVDRLPDGTSISDALRATGTDTGRYYAAFNDNRHQNSAFASSREGMLLSALMTRENLALREWGNPDVYQQQSARAQNTLDALVQHAEAGNEDARWVVGRLNGDTAVRIRVPN